MPRITVNDLTARGADCDQVERFRELRPNDVRWTTQRGLQRIADRLAREGLDVGWAARKFRLTVAVKEYYPDGKLKRKMHCRDGQPHDPKPGTPAVREYYSDETVEIEENYREGLRQRIQIYNN